MKIPLCLILQRTELRTAKNKKGVAYRYAVKAVNALIRFYKCLDKNDRRANKHYNDYLKYNAKKFGVSD